MHYRVMITNEDFDKVCSLHVRQTYADTKILNLISQYMGGMKRPEIMTPTPDMPKMPESKNANGRKKQK